MSKLNFGFLFHNHEHNYTLVMAFSGIGAAAECSTGTNAMSQLMKHVDQDKSLQRERFDSRTQAGPSSIRTQTRPPPDHQDVHLANEFFRQQSSAGPFEFSDLRRELDDVRFAPPPPSAGTWAQEFHEGGPRLWELNPEEALEMEQAYRMHQQSNAPPSAWREEFLHAPPQLTQQQIPPEFEETFQKHFDWAQEFAAKQDKGKGKSMLMDENSTWEEQFAAFDNEDAMNREIDKAAEQEDAAYFEQFEGVWNDVQEKMARAQAAGLDIDPSTWENEFGDFDPNQSPLKPELGPYVFEPQNPYLSHPNPLEEGLRMSEQEGGSLSEAALAFEAAVQRDETNSEAWMQLGTIQAQNEKEQPAIRALEKAVEISNNQNLPALMALAVSYTNEGYDHQSYLTLERWIQAKYPQLVSESATQSSGFSTSLETHQRVTNLFIAAAQLAPTPEQMDPDVQVGLGVLFYGENEFEKSIDCFTAALHSRPRDYLLWNRLGATLANSGRSEDAIDAYHKALEIKPSFVRARYNLGVSCINIGCYREAAEHLLSGLSMHKRDDAGGEGVNTSSNLWETLRRVFLLMDRRDLADIAVEGADINQFRQEFEF